MGSGASCSLGCYPLASVDLAEGSEACYRRADGRSLCKTRCSDNDTKHKAITNEHNRGDGAAALLFEKPPLLCRPTSQLLRLGEP